MKKQITFVLAAFFAAAVISFGCSDSGDSGEIPNDVGGNYTINKSSTCPFALAGGSFSVTQSQTNKESLAISLKAQQKGKAATGATTEPPDFYESSVETPSAAPANEMPSVAPLEESVKTSVISASVSAGGELTAQFKYGETNYDCSGSFKKKDEKKLTDFNCTGGTTTCSFSAEGTTTTPDPDPVPPPTPGEGEEGGVCKADGTCNEGLKCNAANICEECVPSCEGKTCGDDACLGSCGTCSTEQICENSQCVPIPDTSQIITFKDENLKQAVIGAIQAANPNFNSQDVTVNACQVITQLTATGKSIVKLDGLGSCTNLTALNLSNNNIIDIFPLATLTKLEHLELQNNKIFNTAVIKDLTALKYLDLRNNKITTTLHIASNTGLGSGDEVKISGNPLTGAVEVYVKELKSKGVIVDFPIAGEKKTYTADSTSFKMAYVGSGYAYFPTGTDDSGMGTAYGNYWMGETEVTYQLWKKVYDWATAQSGTKKYTFANAGYKGSKNDNTMTDQHPVTTVNWRDAMVFTNALTEWYNAKNNATEADLDCVYYSDATFTTPIRSSADGNFGASVNTAQGSFDDPYVKTNAKGFRLPKSMEWERAARYKGADSSNGAIEYPKNSGIFWTPGDYASGATADYENAEATKAVAWYPDNSGGMTHEVKNKAANTLGLYDMSGNVWDWNFDWHPGYANQYRVLRGGNWKFITDYVRVGDFKSGDPHGEGGGTGFRLSRTE